MAPSSAFAARECRYELRFTGLFDRGRGFAFPCDAAGHVDIDELSDRGRANYFYARTLVGAELAAPIVLPVSPTDIHEGPASAKYQAIARTT